MEGQLEIRTVSTSELPLIVDLAQRTWPATYSSLLSEAQIKYMMDLFYTPASLEVQMTEKQHQFIIAEHNHHQVGFASFGTVPEPGVYKLHKIYILPQWQGKGVGKALIDFIRSSIRETGGTALTLNVNRDNKAKSFYEKLGFSVTGEEDIDIGNGYLMNDFVMRCKL